MGRKRDNDPSPRYESVNATMPADLKAYADKAWRRHVTLDGKLSPGRSAYIADLIARDRLSKKRRRRKPETEEEEPSSPATHAGSEKDVELQPDPQLPFP